eukprot:2129354-Alexandrium_andersonii.AAC.1
MPSLYIAVRTPIAKTPVIRPRVLPRPVLRPQCWMENWLQVQMREAPQRLSSWQQYAERQSRSRER